MSDDAPTQRPTRGFRANADRPATPEPNSGTYGGRPTAPRPPDTGTSDGTDGGVGEGSAGQSGVSWQFSIGDVIADRYRIEKPLGRGGMAEVYAVFDQVKGEVRALKVMSSRLSLSEKARERFVTESQADRLRHPHIVRTIDLGEWKQKSILYITLELVDGNSLRSLIRSYRDRGQTIPWKKAFSICYQVCQALDFAHRHGVVHRDVKPDNVIVRDDNEEPHAWLMDFGIARLAFDAAPSLHTAGGMGTPIYVAPEQRTNAATVTAQADVYSVGVMLYEVLTGRLPEGVFEDASSMVPGLPAEIDDLIRQAMAGTPERRTVSAAILGAHIGRLLKDSGQTLPRTASSAAAGLSMNLGDLVFELQPRKAPQVHLAGISGIPEQILILEGKLEQLCETLKLITAGTHPLVVEQHGRLAQLCSQVEESEQGLRTVRPAVLTNSMESTLRQMIREGQTKPTDFLKAFPSLKSSEVLTYVDELISVEQSQQRLRELQQKFTDRLSSEISRLESEQRTVHRQLTAERQKDLRERISEFFRSYRKEHPQGTVFPYSAWGRFHENVLDKRRYGVSSLEMTEIAEAVFAGEQIEPIVGAFVIAKTDLQSDMFRPNRFLIAFSVFLLVSAIALALSEFIRMN